MRPDVAPSVRTNFMNVYDSLADRVVIFGGTWDDDHVGFDETWAYDVDSNVWTNLNPSAHPHAGWTHRAAYDSQAGRTIMFGGFDGVAGTFTDETWSFDYANNSWTNLQPDSHPSIRSRHGMAYDAQSDRVVLFGGLGAAYYNDTWSFDFEQNRWTELHPASAPEPRRSMGMVYDSHADRIILFGGIDLVRRVYFNDTWAYDLETNTWTNLTPPTAPSARYGHGMVYDVATDRSILYGGWVGSERGLSNETWAYDFASNSWSLVTTDDRPQPLFLHGMAYDVASSQTILFGGTIFENGFPFEVNETWAFTAQPHSPTAPEDFSATPGNANITLRWSPPRYDGLSPITNYRLYRGPDAGNLSLLVELGDARSYVDANVSNGVRYVYRVSAVNGIGEGPPSPAADAIPDGDPPFTSADVSGCVGQAGWFTCVVVLVRLHAVDNITGVAATTYRVDEGAWQTYRDRFFVMYDGVHQVDFYSVDEVGNAEPIRTVSVPIDTAPPTPNVTLNGTAVDGYWFRSLVTVILNGTDATSGIGSIHYRLDGADWQTHTAAFQVGEGRHVLDAYAVDVAGLTGGSVSSSFGVDTVPPRSDAVLQGTVGAVGWYRSLVWVLIEAADATSGVASIQYRIDGGAWQPYSEAIVVGDGTHAVEFYSTDSVGLAEAPRRLELNVDTSAPIVRALLPVGVVTTSTLTVSWTGTDAGSGIDHYEVRVDGGTFESVGSQSSASLQLADGSHTILIRAIDRAGNEASTTFTLRVDTNPLSASGPYGATLDYAIILAVTAVAIAVAFVVIRRRSRAV